jgi:hypothetical protein
MLVVAGCRSAVPASPRKEPTMPGKIPVLVTPEDPVPAEPGVGMLPQRLGKRALSILEVDGGELTANLAGVVSQLHEIANQVQQSSDGYEIEYIDFSLGISKEGKIGMMSAVDLSRGSQAAISIRLKRK